MVPGTRDRDVKGQESDKRALMREIHGRLSPDGALLIYEPTRRDGEDRTTYLDRFEDAGRRNWTALSPTEFEEAMRHVRTCQAPRSAIPRMRTRTLAEGADTSSSR